MLDSDESTEIQTKTLLASRKERYAFCFYASPVSLFCFAHLIAAVNQYH
jgi:hypothetical protein